MLKRRVSTKRLNEFPEQISFIFNRFQPHFHPQKTVHETKCFSGHSIFSWYSVMMIDIQKLRNDIKDYYGTAVFNGSPMAMVDLINVDRLSDQEVVDLALKRKMDLDGYIIKE